MLAAKYLVEKAGSDFGDLFFGQYCMSKASLPHVANWRQPKSLSGWRITHCPKLECRPISDTTGQPLGWLLGTAVDQNGACLGDDLVLPTEVGADDFWAVVENEITFLAGRYIAFLITRKGKRAYFDPVMDLPLVFNAKEKLVGASPLMVLSRDVRTNHRINHKLILTEGGNYGLQQTCDPDVLRGLSNHYLDLDSFSLHRHWPGAEEAFQSKTLDIDETAQTIVDRLGQITGTLLENYSCSMPLTGGRDSRTLAFSAKEKIHLAKCYTHRTKWVTGVDCYLATLLADALGKELQIIDALGDVKAGAVDRRYLRTLRLNFCYRTGYQKALTNEELFAVDRIPECDFVLRGNIMDMTGGHQWPRDFNFSIEHAISKLAIGGRPAEENLAYWAPEYRNWLGTLPEAARVRAYDFAFIEQLLPNTLGGRLIGNPHAIYINPFNDRTLIKACMMVDPKLRKSGRLNQALSAACGAPDVPFVSDVKKDEKLKALASRLFE